MTLLRHVLFGSSLLVLAGGSAGAQPTVSNEFFEAKIRPVLAAKCYSCHNSTLKEPKGYLVLDNRAGVMKGGTLGPAIVPGNPGDSKLIYAMKYADPHLQMPPSGTLLDPAIDRFGGQTEIRPLNPKDQRKIQERLRPIHRKQEGN